MSPPTEETCTQASFRGSSQHAVGAALQDIATFTVQGGHLPRSSTTVSSRAPNSAFARSRARSHSCSVSPGPRREVSPAGLSIVQCCVQLGERTGETVMSNVGQVAEATRQTRGVRRASNQFDCTRFAAATDVTNARYAAYP